VAYTSANVAHVRSFLRRYTRRIGALILGFVVVFSAFLNATDGTGRRVILCGR
jgi:hypothetical protein